MKRDFKISKADIISSSLVIIFVIAMGIKNHYEYKKQREYLDETYKRISINDQIEGTVESIYEPSGLRGGSASSFVTLTNGKGFFIWIYDFLDVETEHIDSFVKPGAKFFKGKGTDSLVVIYGRERYIVKLRTED